MHGVGVDAAALDEGVSGHVEHGRRTAPRSRRWGGSAIRPRAARSKSAGSKPKSDGAFAAGVVGGVFRCSPHDISVSHVTLHAPLRHTTLTLDPPALRGERAYHRR